MRLSIILLLLPVLSSCVGTTENFSNSRQQMSTSNSQGGPPIGTSLDIVIDCPHRMNVIPEKIEGWESGLGVSIPWYDETEGWVYENEALVCRYKLNTEVFGAYDMSDLAPIFQGHYEGTYYRPVPPGTVCEIEGTLVNELYDLYHYKFICRRLPSE